jgi:hypothetical protein
MPFCINDLYDVKVEKEKSPFNNGQNINNPIA